MRFHKTLIFFALVLPAYCLGQDTLLLKKQATVYAKASFSGDYKTVIDLTYPKLVTLSGGRDTMQKLITTRIADLKRQGIIGFDGSVESPGEFYSAGNQLHCLIPEVIVMKMFNGRYVTRTYLLAISENSGRSWTFMDVGKMPIDILQRLVPNYNSQLIIPPPAKPLFFAD